jgi:hypothetical protein
MDPLLLLWLARLGAVLLAAGAGWAYGRSVPGWQADELQDEADPSAGRAYGGCLYPRGFRPYGGYSSSAGCLAAGLVGNGWSVACGAGAIALLACAEGGQDGLFRSPVALVVLLAAVAGYIAAVATDKGPAGPQE